MTKPKQLIHFCEACQENHTFIEEKWPFWGKSKIKGKTHYYCNKGFYCSGCKTIHNTAKVGGSVGKGNPTKWYCNKWVKSRRTSINYDNYSPQDIVSGVHMGLPRQEVWGDDTPDYSVMQRENIKQLESTLDTLE